MLSDITNVVVGVNARPPSKRSPQRPQRPPWGEDAVPASPVRALVKKQILLDSPALGSPSARRQQKESSGSENAMSRRSILEAAINAVLDANLSTGMDSQWTSRLAARLSLLGPDHELDCILRKHGWSGGQFSGPPNKQQFLDDLSRALQTCAQPTKPRIKSRRGGA
uniref:Uncharacterized protein n=1 Tax=Alexandrium catenella TaxID=2925 RepID=A0A7S1MGI6_ALECA